MVSYLGVVRTVMMADTAQFNRAVAGASMQFRAAATKMRMDAQGLVGIGGALNLAITIPAMFAARAITRTGAEYETQMMKIKNVTGMSADAMADFIQKQKQLAKEVNTSRIDLAKIGYLGAQAQIIDPDALAKFQTAIAKAQHILPGDAPNEVVAEGFRTIINSFKLSSEEFEPIMAQLVKTINLGSISWREYAKTISFVTSIAAATKTPEALQNMNMAMAVLTHGGGQTGQRAARSLRAIYSSIYKTPTKEATSLAVSMGYRSFADMFERGAGSDLLRFMKMFPESIRNMGGMSKMGFTRESVTSALGLANAADPIIQRFKQEFANAMPDFMKQFEDAKKNSEYIINQLSRTWTDLKIAFFEALGPSLIKGLQALTTALQAMADSPALLKQLAAGLIALASAISIGAAAIGIVKTIGLAKQLGLWAPLIGSLRLRPTAASKIKGMIPSDVVPGAKGWHDVLARNKKGEFVPLSKAQREAGVLGMNARLAGGKTIFTQLGGLLKFLGIIYIISAAFRGLGRVLEVTLWPVIQDMLPSGVSLKNAFSALLGVLKRVDEFIVNVFMYTFAGVVGTFENLFGAIVGGVMAAINSIKYFWSGLTMWFRDSVIGRKLNINPTAEELAEYEQLKKDRLGKLSFWAQYASGQFKGMFGGEESAVTRILDDIMERRNKRAGVELANSAGVELANRKKRNGGTAVDDALAAAYGMTVPSQSPGFFEYGTLGGYEARVAATDAIYEVMKELKDKSIKALEDIKAELELINEREDGRDQDGALLGAT